MKRILLVCLSMMMLPISLSAQWQILNKGFSGDVRIIDFVTDALGYLAGFDGTLLKTEVAGIAGKPRSKA